MTRREHEEETTVFDRISMIPDRARTNVVRAINSEMVIAYWSIGMEIVEVEQKGKQRADYGKQMLEILSKKLTLRYGRGFSTANLWNFRQFFPMYHDRIPDILYPLGRELPHQYERNELENIDQVIRIEKMNNSTVGLILCTDKNESVVKYVLGEKCDQIFASRFRLVLQSEDELRRELDQGRRSLEN
jgi:hypothetical protein